MFAAGCDFSFVLNKSILHFDIEGRSRRGEGVRRPLRKQRVAGSNLNDGIHFADLRWTYKSGAPIFRICGEPQYVFTELNTSFCISQFYLVLLCVICSTMWYRDSMPAAKKMSLDALTWRVNLAAC